MIGGREVTDGNRGRFPSVRGAPRPEPKASGATFADPHLAAPAEGEALRIRTLPPLWRWLLIVASALTIFLCVNQQFVLRFFIGFTPLNTEYYYALVLVMLPFVFVVFPGGPRSPLDRVTWLDAVLFILTAAASLWLLLNIRKAAELGWEFGGAPQSIVCRGSMRCCSPPPSRPRSCCC